jgi:hypothetical protein
MLARMDRPPPPDPATEAAAAAWLTRRRGRPLRSPGRRLGALIENVAPARETKPGPRLSELKARWREVVGEKLAGVCEPDAIKGASLSVRVIAAAAPLLQMREKEIVGLVALSGWTGIKRLTLVRAPLTSAKAPAAPRPRMLDAAERRALDAQLAQVENSALKAALTRLAEAVAGMP